MEFALPGKKLHRGRVYLTLAGVLFLALPVLLYVADDAIVFAMPFVEEFKRDADRMVVQALTVRMAVLGPVAILTFVAAALLIRARARGFIMIVALVALVLSGVMTYFVVDHWFEVRDLDSVLPKWLRNRAEIIGLHWFKFWTSVIVNGVGYYASLLALVLLSQSDVRAAFAMRRTAVS